MTSAYQMKPSKQPTPDELLEEQLMKEWVKQQEENYLNMCYIQGVAPIIEAGTEHRKKYSSVTSPNNKVG